MVPWYAVKKESWVLPPGTRGNKYYVFKKSSGSLSPPHSSLSLLLGFQKLHVSQASVRWVSFIPERVAK